MIAPPYGQGWKPGSINGFAIDVFVSSDRTYAADVPDDPVEDGTNLTDNVVLKPLTVTVEGWVSDTPVYPQPDAGTAPADDAIAALLFTYFAAEPVTVHTATGDIDNLAITSLSIPRDASTGYALQFKASFKQITIVQNTRTTVRVATPSAQNKTNLGNKQPAQIDVAAIKAITDKVNDSIYQFPNGSVADRLQRADGLGYRPLKGGQFTK